MITEEGVEEVGWQQYQEPGTSAAAASTDCSTEHKPATAQLMLPLQAAPHYSAAAAELEQQEQVWQQEEVAVSN